MIVPDSLLNLILFSWFEKICGVTGTSNAQKLRLYTNDMVPTPSTILSDFLELTAVEVPGYAAQTSAYSSIGWRTNVGDYIALQNAQPTVFLASGNPPVPITVYGWFSTLLFNPAVLSASGRFTTPFVYSSKNDAVILPGMWAISQIGPVAKLVLTPPDFEPVSL